MPNYLLVFHGGTAPQSEEEGRKVMQEWTSWMDGLGAAVVDGGNPASRTKTIGGGGTVTDTSNGPSGYSIISANSIDEAVELAKGCPVLHGGATVQVVETFPIM